MRTLLTTVMLVAALATPSSAGAYATDPRPLPTGTDVDYQLGGAAQTPADVGIVVRDRTARPVAGRYNICYVNGFQTQPDERAFWEARRDLLLSEDGKPVEDEAWGEWLLDIRTPAKRRRLAEIVGGWTAGCAEDGFDAVEFDNLDSFSRSNGLIRARHAKAFAKLLTAKAHGAGLTAAQKNWSDWNGTAAGYDFAIAEECGRWKECGSYVDSYGDQVLIIEYRARDFTATCAAWGDRLAIVLRDVDLTPNGVRRWC